MPGRQEFCATGVFALNTASISCSRAFFGLPFRKKSIVGNTAVSFALEYPDMAHHDHASSDGDNTIDSLEEQPQTQQHANSCAATNGALEKQSTVSSGLSIVESRAQSAVSRIRSRNPGQNAPFTHPLSHMKTSSDVIVDFDGPDDPYRPVNWGFGKKAVTTVLYGLTTMGMLLPVLTESLCRG